MATPAHCAYCFESLSSALERRQPLSLQQVQDLWADYTLDDPAEEQENVGKSNDTQMTDVETKQDSIAQPAAVSRLVNHTPASPSSSSLSTTKSSTSSTAPPSSSKSSSFSSLLSRGSKARGESRPLFVTWNTISRSGHKSLRGCIGTFEAQELSEGLRSYALTSAFEDHRFSPIPASLIPNLQCCVTLLTNFSSPDPDPMNWTVGKHGIRISFNYHGRRYGATYLPDVAREQGWTKEEALVSLMRKAGWNGRKDEWRRVQGLEIVRYEGEKVDLDYTEWRDWRDWVEAKGVGRKPLN